MEICVALFIGLLLLCLLGLVWSLADNRRKRMEKTPKISVAHWATLDRLDALKAKGVLSEAEYQAEKEHISRMFTQPK